MPAPPHPPASPRLGLREKIGYGLGTFADQLTTNAVNSTVKPVFNMFLGMNPSLVGAALMIGKLVDAVTDPVMGSISDNTRTRWGRRRPYVLFGSLGCALCFPLLWFVPQGLGDASMFAYLLVATSLIAVLSTIYCVPWTALGFELTPDHHERTSVMAWRTVLTMAIWLLIPWLWAWSQADIFANPLVGMRWLGLGLAVLILGSSVLCFKWCRERYYTQAAKQSRVGLVSSFALTLRNRAFLILMGITLVQVLAIATTIGGLQLYVSSYWVFGGDLAQGAKYAAFIGMQNSVLSFANIPVITRVSRRIGKPRTLSLCFTFAILGTVANWFCYTPAAPWMIFIPPFFLAPSAAAFWMINGSMRADVIDDDEVRTGLRREGAFGSIARLIEKIAFAASFFISGLILDLVGFDAELGGAQSPGALLGMRLAYSLMPATLVLSGLWLIRKYPLSEDTLAGYRRELEQRRGAV